MNPPGSDVTFALATIRTNPFQVIVPSIVNKMVPSLLHWLIKSWRTLVLSVGPLIPLFWNSGDISPWFQSPHLHTSWLMCNRFFQFTSGMTTADLFVASMAAKLFDPHICTYIQVLVELEPGIAYAAWCTSRYTKLREGNVFTGVCLSIGGGVCLRGKSASRAV